MLEDKKTINLREQAERKMANEGYLREQQRRYTGKVIQNKGVEEGGMVVDFNYGKHSFMNLAEAIQWCKDNFGIINNPDGTRLCGETIDELKEKGVL
jgi:hypothetical protein